MKHFNLKESIMKGTEICHHSENCQRKRYIYTELNCRIRLLQKIYGKNEKTTYLFHNMGI